MRAGCGPPAGARRAQLGTRREWRARARGRSMPPVVALVEGRKCAVLRLCASMEQSWVVQGWLARGPAGVTQLRVSGQGQLYQLHPPGLPADLGALCSKKGGFLNVGVVPWPRREASVERSFRPYTLVVRRQTRRERRRVQTCVMKDGSADPCSPTQLRSKRRSPAMRCFGCCTQSPPDVQEAELAQPRCVHPSMIPV